LNSEEGKFSVEFPGKPEFNTELGSEFTSKVLSYKFDMIERDCHFSVNVIFIDENITDLKTYLKKIADTYANKYHGELNEILELNIDENIGFEVDIKLNDNYSMRARLYYKNGKLYEVLVSMPSDRKNTSDINNFLNSFVIK
jgi:hypothetical protein